MKKFILVFLIALFNLAIYSQDISLTATADNSVSTGEKFQLKYTLSNARASSFNEPDLDDFQMLGTSQYQSSGGTTIVINGQVVQQGNSSQTWVYTLSCSTAGTYTIPAASATANGTTYKSNSVTVTVSGANITSSNSTSDNLSKANGDIFIDLSVDKSEVYVGEQILATARFYSRYDIVSFGDAEFPAFDGFWTQDVYTPTNIQFDVKTISSTKYLTALWQQKILIPQKSGALTIGKYKIGCIVGSWGFASGEKTGYSSEKIITVKALPTAGKPTDFSGAVGSFEIAASADKTQVNIDEPITITIEISGTGNFELFEMPEYTLPNSFETFDPEETNNTDISTEGITGSSIIKYVIIPRAPGNFEIPDLTFTYFNPSTASYVDISAKGFNIKVDGVIDSTANNYVAIKSDVEDLGSDIMYIETNDLKLKEIDKTFFGSKIYYSSLLALLSIFFAIIVFKRQQIKQNANVALLRNKKANKVSQKRLKNAAVHMKNGNKDLFYEEVLKAVWGYVSDKLTIPVSELSRENIVENLNKFNIDNDFSNEFIKLLDECEFARYAPASDQSAQMHFVYDNSSSIIGKLEQLLRK